MIVSAYGDMANIRTAMNRGAFDFVTKPIDFADLETTIGKTLRNLEITRGYQRRQQEAERARAQLARYFSPSLVDCITAATDDIDLGAQRRDITSMFTDIASFTTLVEGLEPHTIGPLLNEYLTGMTGIVFDHGGTLVKIVGDALNVLFGAPADQPDHAEHAVACALALDAYAEDFRARWRDKGVAVATTRIGMNSGPALVGNFGGGRFFDYTAYGDTINIAARLEAANKQFGTRICVSGSVVERIAGFRGRPVGNVLLRGRSEASGGARTTDGGAPRRRADCRVSGCVRQGGRMRPGRSVCLRGTAGARQRRRAGQLPSEAAADRRHRRLGRARMTMGHYARRTGASRQRDRPMSITHNGAVADLQRANASIATAARRISCRARRGAGAGGRAGRGAGRHQPLAGRSGAGVRRDPGKGAQALRRRGGCS